MRPRMNEVQAIYKSAPPNSGKINVVIMTKEDYASIHGKAKPNIEKTTRAAGEEMPKTARIAMRRGMRQQQGKGLKELNTLLKKIRLKKTKKDVYTQTGIATGYANAMRSFDLISENELKDVIGVIGQANEQTIRRIEAAARSFWLRIIRKWVRL